MDGWPALHAPEPGTLPVVSEQLETYDEPGRAAGLVERAAVHATGLWHCAAHVWLFDGAGRVLLQRRVASKDVYPDCWDLSVGEHLQPGETYEQAAHRGLAEELGIAGVSLATLGGVRRMQLDLPAAGIRDYELQQSFRTRHDGPVTADPAEVAAAEFFTLEELQRALADRPDDFTPWCRQDAHDLALV